MKTKTTEKIHVSSEESINLQELEETPQKKKCITKRSSGKMGNVASWSDDLILRLIDKIYNVYEAWLCPGDIFWSRDFARVTAGELSSTIVTSLAV